MDPRVNYTLVGLFVVGLGVALAAVIIWLSGGTEDKVYQTYVAYVYESVAGLNPRAPVKYRGWRWVRYARSHSTKTTQSG